MIEVKPIELKNPAFQTIKKPSGRS